MKTPITTVFVTACAAALLLLLGTQRAAAHYPFPCSRDERAKAKAITEAQQERVQASVTALGRMLRDDNRRVRVAALLGLMRLSGAELDFLDVHLRFDKLTNDEDAFVRAATRALRILLDRETPVDGRRDKLVELTRSKDGHERRAAVEALGQIGDASVLPALEALAADSFGDHDDAFDMRANSRVAFHAWWSIPSPGLSADERLRALVGTLHLGEPFHARWCDAACDLLEKRGQDAVPHLIPLARGDEKRAKLWAVRTLRSIGGKEAVSVVVDVCTDGLDSDDRTVRQSSAYTLWAVADARSLPVLVRALASHDDAGVRERAAATLGRIDDGATVAALKAALSDENLTVRTRAAWGLARKGIPDGDRLLIEALGHLEGSTGYIAVDAMVHIQDTDGLSQATARLFRAQPGEDDFTERQRIWIRQARSRVFSQLGTWPADKLRQFESVLRPLVQGHESVTGRAILRKLESDQRQ